MKIGLLLCLLACNAWPLSLRAPTATPVVIPFQVNAPARPVDDPIPPSPVPLAITPAFVTPAPALSQPAVISPALTLTLEAAPSPTPPAPPAVLTPTATGLPAPATVTPTIVLTPTPTGSGAGIYNGEIIDQLTPIDPQPGYTLPAGQGHLEFKWGWSGAELRPCQLEEGLGFEVRLWPDPNDPGLAAGATVSPMGTIDAVEIQALIAGSCNPDTGVRRYTVEQLRDTPAVRLAGGSGHFFWDVAYIQLEPYYRRLGVSAPRDFFIPPSLDDPPTPTATPTAIAPEYVAEPGPKPAGTITLLAPEPGRTFNFDATREVQFKWRWDGPLIPETCQPAAGYGFEVRIGSRQPGFAPLGVMDAVKAQDQIGCDPAAKDFYLTVLDLKETPGVAQTFSGSNQWDGQFFWDVALVSLNPYLPPDSTSSPRPFEIELASYHGQFDPTGAPLKCSDLPTWPEAQAVFIAAGGPGSDPHGLDPDGNGVACDELRP